MVLVIFRNEVLMRKTKGFLLTFISAIMVIIMVGCNGSDLPSSADKPELEVSFIDVGQGDSTLVISPSGKTMLIDAGDNSYGKNVVEYIKELGISKIDVLVGTHPDADHIGGIDMVIDNFEIGTFYMPKKTHTTKTYEDVLTSAKNKGLKITAGIADKVIDFDPDVKAVILSPENKNYSDNNAYSIAIQLTYGKNKFLFTGDIEKENEKDMISKYGNSLRSDVIKLAHHGSSTSNDSEFLDIVSPDAAVVSCAYKNKYGHPHKEVLNYLEENDIPLYRTDEQGTIVIYSDGNELSVNQDDVGSYEYRKGN